MLIRQNLYPMHYSANHLACPHPALLLFCLSLLPATGMTQCNAQLTEYTPTSAFILRNDGTVQHQKTGLIWSRCSVGQVWQDNTCQQTASTYTYFAAFEQAQRANAAHYLGFNTWHLPSVEEVQSLVELRCAQPAINTSLFPNTPSSWYWSASSRAPRRVPVLGRSFPVVGKRLPSYWDAASQLLEIGRAHV